MEKRTLQKRAILLVTSISIQIAISVFTETATLLSYSKSKRTSLCTSHQINQDSFGLSGTGDYFKSQVVQFTKITSNNHHYTQIYRSIKIEHMNPKTRILEPHSAKLNKNFKTPMHAAQICKFLQEEYPNSYCLGTQI